jgi:iron complex outermembrane receptor protein
VRINGMEALATYGGANAGGGTNRGRAFDYNVFAADLFRQIRLQKTASADVDEGSLGATIDLQTRSAFDARDKSATLTVEGAYNSRSELASPRITAMVSRRLLGDRLGLLVSAAYSNAPCSTSAPTPASGRPGRGVSRLWLDNHLDRPEPTSTRPCIRASPGWRCSASIRGDWG